jgi:hypothetical protein
MSGVLSPRRRLYPPACKPSGLEAEPEAAAFRPRRTKVRLPAKYMRDKRTKTLVRPCSSKKFLIYELETT